MPLYDQTALITGMSMYGKMSTGMLTIAATPSKRMARDITTKV
jgi:hypothetical protein